MFSDCEHNFSRCKDKNLGRPPLNRQRRPPKSFFCLYFDKILRISQKLLSLIVIMLICLLMHAFDGTA